MRLGTCQAVSGDGVVCIHFFLGILIYATAQFMRIEGREGKEGERETERDRERQKERKPGRWIPIVMLNQDRQELLNGVF